MSYLNSATIVGFVGADPEQRQARNNGSKFTVLSVATQRSWKKRRRRMGLASRVASRRFFALGWLSALSATSRKALMCRSKAASSARPTGRTAKARGPRPRRSLRGRFAPMLCASSTAASQNRKHPHPVRTLQCCRPIRVTKRRSDTSLQKGLRHRRRPFFVRPELRPEKEKLAAAHCFPVYGRPGFAFSFFKAQGLTKLSASSPLLAARHMTQGM